MTIKKPLSDRKKAIKMLDIATFLPSPPSSAHYVGIIDTNKQFYKGKYTWPFTVKRRSRDRDFLNIFRPRCLLRQDVPYSDEKLSGNRDYRR